MADGFVPTGFRESEAAVEIAAPNTGPEAPVVGGVALRRGSRVRLRPAQRTDIVDLALAGRVAEVDRVEEDADGRVHVVVVLDGDPGRDLGAMSQIGHRFFFAPEELEPLAEAGARPPGPQVLVAGIGDFFRTDGAFGREVVDRLRRHHLPQGVHVADFGIRGTDLARTLRDDYDAALLLCTTSGKHAPGTLSVLETDAAESDVADRTCGIDPFEVLARARRPGTDRRRFLVVGCRAAQRASGGASGAPAELSGPVLNALDEAVRLVEGLLDGLRGADRSSAGGGSS